MDHELVSLLVCVGVGIAVGVPLTILIVTRRPGWCKAWAKFSMNRPWPINLSGVGLFALSVLLALDQRRYCFAAFFAGFFLLEVAAFFLFGFRRLTPEEEKRIDSSDPAGNARRFFHKLVGNGGQPHPS